MISKSWLSMFDCFELQMLISGGKDDINIDDWKNNVEYGGYLDDDPAVIMFWEIVEEMTPQERCKLIKFVTSVSRAPLLDLDHWHLNSVLEILGMIRLDYPQHLHV